MSLHFEVELSDGAERDLEDIHAYLLDHASQREADTLLDAFLAKIESLEHFPARGSVPKEFERQGYSAFRQLVMPPYRIFYQVIGTRVIVSMVIDGRRDVDLLIEEFLATHSQEEE
jgi:toxin ParE1/3/4